MEYEPYLSVSEKISKIVSDVKLIYPIFSFRRVILFIYCKNIFLSKKYIFITFMNCILQLYYIVVYEISKTNGIL